MTIDGGSMRRMQLGLALFLALFAMSAGAQAYPTKTVRVILGFPPGGVTDVLIRAIAQQLTEKLNAQFIVDNRPGATGMIASDAVARAAPDGYTLLGSPGSAITSLPHLRTKMPYDSLKDLAPVIQIAGFSYVLVTHPGVPARTVKDLVSIARTQPGFLTFASPGIGTAFHLSGELLQNMAKIEMLHIPYKGGAAALIDLVTGRIDFMFYSVGVVHPSIESGKLRAIAVTGERRHPQLPDVPTIDESGLPGYEMVGWQGIFTTAGTSEQVIERLNSTISRILLTPEMKAFWTKQGMDFSANSPGQFSALVASEYQRYGTLIKTAGIKPQ
jgi:tripartite-type tricarboxylate transporter receptor subunit TctC